MRIPLPLFCQGERLLQWHVNRQRDSMYVHDTHDRGEMYCVEYSIELYIDKLTSHSPLCYKI